MILPGAVYGLVLSFVVATGIVAQELHDSPGPLEKQARQVTPENPVPRQLTSKAIEYPGEMHETGGRGSVTLQITLDAEGKVKEIRTLRTQLMATSAPFPPSSPFRSPSRISRERST